MPLYLKLLTGASVKWNIEDIVEWLFVVNLVSYVTTTKGNQNLAILMFIYPSIYRADVYTKVLNSQLS